MTAMKLIPKYVDELGKLRAELSALKKREEELKKIMIEAHKKTGKDRFEGKLFEVLVTTGSRTSWDIVEVKAALTQEFIAEHATAIDMEAVKEELGPEWVTEHAIDNTYYIVRPSVKK